jgi:hypothetical protein
MSHDIALIQLDEYLHYDNNVQPVLLPQSGDTRLLEDKSVPVHVAGWGQTGALINTIEY